MVKGILNKTKFTALFLSIFIWLTFWIKGLIFLDPDFGWHLKMGQLILSSGIPKTDPFSYTMPSFAFVDHEWLTDILIAWLYPKIGHFGLAGIYACLAWGAILIALKIPGFKRLTKVNLWYLEPAFFLFAAAAVLPFAGIRPQVISWFFLSILLAVTLNRSLWQRWRWYLPLLLIFWSNLHGGFPLGILVLFFLTVGEGFQKRKLETEKLVILISGGLGTLINPYGIRLWEEVWRVTSDTSSRWTIAEWQPSLFVFNPPFLYLAVFFSILIHRYRSRFSYGQLALFLFFLIQAMASLRHLPLWVIVALPMAKEPTFLLYKEAQKIKYGAERFKKFFSFIFWLSMAIFLLVSTQTLIESRLFQEGVFYPSGAIEFLKRNSVKGEIFSEYGWGGYLIWKLPERKVFIDGRMPSWRRKSAPPGESKYVMKEYLEILRDGVSYPQIFDQYQIKTVLWPQPRKASFFERLDEKLARFLFNKKEKADFFQRLVKDGWGKIYQDSTSVIFQKPS